MKITIPSNILLAALQTLSMLAHSRTTLPILSCALFRAKDGVLTITSNDLDTALELTVDAAIESDGAAAIRVIPIIAMLRNISSPQITLTVGKRTALLVGNGEFSVSLEMEYFADEEFPPMSKGDFGEFTKLPAATFRQVIGLLDGFQSQDETRYVINGFNFDRTTAVATDGRRIRTVAMPRGNARGILRPLFVEILHKLAAVTGSDIQLSVGESLAMASGGQWKLSSRVIEGNYPNYPQVIPERATREITFNTGALRSALVAMSAFQSAKCDGVSIMPIADQKVLLERKHEDRKLCIALPAKYKEFAPTILNTDFLAHLVNSHPEEEITLNQADELSPVRVDTGRELPSITVLMPMRVR